MNVVLITGCSSGIGLETALAFARRGGATYASMRDPARATRLRERAEAEGLPMEVLALDVTDDASVMAAVRAVQRRHGAIDVLVNNAGSARAIGPVWEVDPDEWWQDIESSLRSAFLCSRAVLPGMLERGAGRILNVSSYVALRPTPYISGYAAAKAALLSLTEALAASVGDTDVRVFAVTPGRFHSELMRHLMDSEAGKRWLPGIGEGGRWVEPERVAQLILFLATGKGDELNGRFLHALDDLDELVERADEIVRDDLFTPRLRR